MTGDSIERATAADASFRDAIQQKADDLNVNLDDVLLQSRRRDPLNVGTSSDHKKGEWFAELWTEAISQRDADTIHIRGLHYVVVQLDRDIEPPTARTSWDRYRNAAKCYGYLTDAGACARVLGYVPIGGVVDEKNQQERITEYTGHDVDVDVDRIGRPAGISVPDVPEVDDRAELRFEDLDDYIDRVARRVARAAGYRLQFNTAEQQPFHIEVWSEKALPDAVRNAAKDAGADAIVEGEGHLSYRVAHDFVTRVETAEKPAVVLYLADFDPAGENMPGAMAAKISWLDKSDALSQRVCLSRLAVTAEQVDDLDLPREPVEVDPSAASYHTLAQDWQSERGGGAVELSALEADLENYCRIVRDGVLSASDPDIRRKNRDAEQEFKDELEDSIREQLADSDLDAVLSDLQDWIERFNQQLDDAREPLQQLRDVATEGVDDDWQRTVRDAIEDVDVPDVDVPEGDAAPPQTPLYDSARPYMENVRVIKGGDN